MRRLWMRLGRRLPKRTRWPEARRPPEKLHPPPLKRPGLCSSSSGACTWREDTGCTLSPTYPYTHGTRSPPSLVPSTATDREPTPLRRATITTPPRARDGTPRSPLGRVHAAAKEGNKRHEDVISSRQDNTREAAIASGEETPGFNRRVDERQRKLNIPRMPCVYKRNSSASSSRRLALLRPLRIQHLLGRIPLPSLDPFIQFLQS